MNDRDLGLLFGKSVKAAGDVSSLVFVFLAQSEQLDDVTVTEHAELFPSGMKIGQGKPKVL